MVHSGQVGSKWDSQGHTARPPPHPPAKEWQKTRRIREIYTDLLHGSERLVVKMRMSKRSGEREGGSSSER